MISNAITLARIVLLAPMLALLLHPSPGARWGALGLFCWPA